jgi:hypothetical protein
MLSLHSAAALSFSAPLVAQPTRAVAPVMESVADLKTLADKCNPALGFWDPIGLMANVASTEEATVGWFRHAEIKHGRVAMAAFVGFIVQSNGIFFPWNLANGVSHADISAAGGPAAQWDALPTSAKLQIIGFVGFLELYSEASYVLNLCGEKHYVKGGKPGFFPPLDTVDWPHPVPLNLWDPFGFTKKMTPERKEKALIAEINNGRLAQIGIMGFMAASKGLIVPGMDSLGIAPYAGEVMVRRKRLARPLAPLTRQPLDRAGLTCHGLPQHAVRTHRTAATRAHATPPPARLIRAQAPFTAGDTALPLVADMLKYQAPF